MKLVVVSGKGGTGKTLVSSSLASLTGVEVLAIDADVDASNLPMLLPGMEIPIAPFSGAKLAQVHPDCIGCGACEEACRFGAMTMVNMTATVNPILCEGCGACRHVCPIKGIKLVPEQTAQVFVNERGKGDVIYANMYPGTEGSGKLVTELRKLGEEKSKHMILDGSPGVGCPVIASVINTDLALVVTEPSVSAMSDMKRVLTLLKKMEIPSKVIINKYDLKNELTNEIHEYLAGQGIEVLGHIPFDPKVMEAVNRALPITHMKESKAKDAMIDIYENHLRRYFYENSSC